MGRGRREDGSGENESTKDFEGTVSGDLDFTGGGGQLSASLVTTRPADLEGARSGGGREDLDGAVLGPKA
jgi:hypothetical protein